LHGVIDALEPAISLTFEAEEFLAAPEPVPNDPRDREARGI